MLHNLCVAFSKFQSKTIEQIFEQCKVSNVSVQKDSKAIAVKLMQSLIHVFLLHASMVSVDNDIQRINEHQVMKSQNSGVIVLLALKAIDVKYRLIIARAIRVQKMLLCVSIL